MLAYPDVTPEATVLSTFKIPCVEGDLRFACLAYAALRWGCVFPDALALPWLLDEARQAEAERQWRRPIAELVERWAAATYFLLDLADEARCLMAEIR